MTPNRKAIAAVSVALAALAGLFVAALSEDPDPCERIRDRAVQETELLDAAVKAGGLTLAETNDISRRRKILAAAVRSCDPKPTPSPSPVASSAGSPSALPSAVPGAWPGPGNTGVPAGMTLAAYSGPCTITTANTIIDGKTIKCDLEARAKGVVVRRSKIVGTVSSTEIGSLTLENVEVDGGTEQLAATGEANLTIRRSNIHGGQTSVNCTVNCLVEDSWLHGQYVPPDGNWHLDGFLSNGGNHITLKHNTIACDAAVTPNDGGCTAAAAIFGDFAPNNYYTFDNNLFVASVNQAYCLYGGSQANKTYGLQTDHIVVVNNVFQRGTNGKCGAFGPITYFDASRPGNQWSNNRWDDGTPLNP